MSGQSEFMKEICFDIGQRIGELKVYADQAFMGSLDVPIFEWVSDVAEDFNEWWNGLDPEADSDKLTEYSEQVRAFLDQKLAAAGFVPMQLTPESIDGLKDAYGLAASSEKWDIWPDFDEEGDTGRICIGSRECPSLVTCGEGTLEDAQRVALTHNTMPKLLAVVRWADATRDWAQQCFPEYADVEVVNELEAALKSLDGAKPGKKPACGG